MKDRARRGVDVVTGIVARIGRAAGNAMMLRFLPAFIAERHPVWMETAKEPIKACRVIRKLSVKLFLGVAAHFRFAVHVFSLTYSEGKL